MVPVSTTLEGENSPVPLSRISLADVNHWLTNLYTVPYRYSRKWRTPRELKIARHGDCKGKAVALYATMRKHGARNIYLVIGKRHFLDSQTHAWLEWQTTRGTYLLDPTFNWTTAMVEEQSITYIPFYAYDGARKYCTACAPPLPTSQLSRVSQAPNGRPSNSAIGSQYALKK